MKIKIDEKSIELKYAKTFCNRLKGFIFKKNINYALCFPKCNSVHTMFMLKHSDIIMTDKNYNILYVFKDVKPYRIILPKKNVYYTFEFPVNIFNFDNTKKIKITKK